MIKKIIGKEKSILTFNFNTIRLLYLFVKTRVLQLPNGMKIMLISDPNISETAPEVTTTDGVDNMGYSSAEDEEDSDSEADENCESGDEHEEGSDEESENDTDEDAEPESIESGGAEHGGSRKAAGTKEGDRMAAASLCVKVGSFSDPADIPGLAHFLEHMVFMGSKNFPEENAFDEFLKVKKKCKKSIYLIY